MAARARGGSTASASGPRSDVYTGLLGVALIAQIIGVLFFFLDWSQYPTTAKPALPTMPQLTAGQQK